jgi:hypothetical protein
MDALVGTVQEPRQPQLNVIGTSRPRARCFVSVMWTSVMPSDITCEKANPRLDRRTALLGSAAAVQLSLFAAAGSEEMVAPNQAPGPYSQPRYRETPHIRTFYDRSRF